MIRGSSRRFVQIINPRIYSWEINLPSFREISESINEGVCEGINFQKNY